VFEIDMAHCPNCGGQLKIIAAIPDAPVIWRMLFAPGDASARVVPGAGEGRFSTGGVRTEPQLRYARHRRREKTFSAIEPSSGS